MLEDSEHTSSVRKLAAIMFTDIVGYTKLMGSDEGKAVEMLSRNRTIHQSSIKKFNGILIKEIGDGILATFSLASDAVRCAMEIQKECKTQKIPLKIGIHEGELVFEGNDIVGDAVNIASRLQEDTPLGCISISGKLYSDIKNRADIRSILVGERSFKNVDEPIKVYRVLSEGEEPDQVSDEAKVKKSKSKRLYYIHSGIVMVIIAILLLWEFLPNKKKVEVEKSIAVLPFEDLSAEKNN
jgi:class 3 adenylate cyclase